MHVFRDGLHVHIGRPRVLTHRNLPKNASMESDDMIHSADLVESVQSTQFSFIRGKLTPRMLASACIPLWLATLVRRRSFGLESIRLVLPLMIMEQYAKVFTVNTLFNAEVGAGASSPWGCCLLRRLVGANSGAATASCKAVSLIICLKQCSADKPNGIFPLDVDQLPWARRSWNEWCGLELT